MFSGIGGFELGIQKSTGGKWECIGFSEIDRYAVQVYKKQFPTHKNFGNAREINTDELSEFELLTAGFPCQSFSIAGKRKGFQDTRGTLFHEILKVADAKRPRILLLENVKGLLSADNGRCFATIISSLDELGYDVEWQVLNAKYFGVPQNRERVFIIGHSRKGSGRQVFPIRQDEEADFSLRTITSRYFASNSNGNYICNIEKKREIKVIDARNYQNESEKRVYDNISPTLMARARTDETPMIFAMRSYPRSESIKDNPNQDRFQNMEINKERISNTLSGVQKDNLVLDTPYSMGTTKPNRSAIGSQRVPEIGTKERIIRRLTEIECERLMGFPDNFTKEGIDEKGNVVPISATQRYKQLGNSVVVNVVYAIVKKLKEVYKQRDNLHCEGVESQLNPC